MIPFPEVLLAPGLSHYRRPERQAQGLAYLLPVICQAPLSLSFSTFGECCSLIQHASDFVPKRVSSPLLYLAHLVVEISL